VTRPLALITAAALAATLIPAAPAAAADPPDPRPSHGASGGTSGGGRSQSSRPAPQPSAGAGGGVQVGPPLPATPPPAGGGSVAGTGKPDDPGFFDIPGKVRKAIDDWFRGLVKDALHPVMDLLGKTLLSTPQLATQPRVTQLWQVSLGIANALLVLLIVAAGTLVMGHETLQSRYALKDAIPRLALGAIAANASLAICGQMIEIAKRPTPRTPTRTSRLCRPAAASPSCSHRRPRRMTRIPRPIPTALGSRSKLTGTSPP
jgi:hypothetical protein